MSRTARGSAGMGKKSEYQDKDKPTQIRFSNIIAAKGNYDKQAVVAFSVMLAFNGIFSEMVHEM